MPSSIDRILTSAQRNKAFAPRFLNNPTTNRTDFRGIGNAAQGMVGIASLVGLFAFGTSG